MKVIHYVLPLLLLSLAPSPAAEPTADLSAIYAELDEALTAAAAAVASRPDNPPILAPRAAAAPAPRQTPRATVRLNYSIFLAGGTLRIRAQVSALARADGGDDPAAGARDRWLGLLAASLLAQFSEWLRAVLPSSVVFRRGLYYPSGTPGEGFVAVEIETVRVRRENMSLYLVAITRYFLARGIEVEHFPVPNAFFLEGRPPAGASHRRRRDEIDGGEACVNKADVSGAFVTLPPGFDAAKVQWREVVCPGLGK